MENKKSLEVEIVARLLYFFELSFRPEFEYDEFLVMRGLKVRNLSESVVWSKLYSAHLNRELSCFSARLHLRIQL